MEGENIIITGANRGIGKELVKVFAEAGANIWACMRKEMRILFHGNQSWNKYTMFG